MTIVNSDSALKTCARCKQRKPATPDYFYRAKARRDGFAPYCKDCRGAMANRTSRRRAKLRVGETGESEKQCTHCGGWFGASSKHFYAHDGKLGAVCKDCVAKQRGVKRREREIAPREVGGTLQKPCTKCGALKPATPEFFTPMKGCRLGLHPWCRPCLSAYGAANLAKRRPDIKKQTRERNVDGRVERKCTTCDRWMPATREFFQPQAGCRLGLRPTCRECMRAKSILYAETHREQSVLRASEWNNANRERHLQHMRAVVDKRRKAPGRFTADDIVRLLEKQQGKCFYCGQDAGPHYHVDHFVPLAKGGTHHPENIVIACAKCNRRKSAKDPHAFVAQMAALRSRKTPAE